MEQNNSDKKIFFSINTADIITEILKKYSLEDNPVDLEKNLSESQKEPFIIRGAVILQVVLKLAKKEIAEPEASSFLQKDLNISQEISDKIINEIKTNILPFTTDRRENAEENKPSPRITPRPSVTAGEIEMPGSTVKTPTPIETPIKKVRKPLPKKPITPEPTPQKFDASDKYREPIE